ncbi:unnamed protein product [Ilex paraguariensis]|uniref:Uncharacterized protein n=1 Tax=Ilex paraguariensis TaxID=185542 RepID=A0ABC8UQ86_9AQUA
MKRSVTRYFVVSSEMEAHHKLTEFTKGKLVLIPLYQTGKPSSAECRETIIPNSSSSKSYAYVNHSPEKKPPAFGHDSGGGDLFGDESVDLRAANYISVVRERFRLEMAS